MVNLAVSARVARLRAPKAVLLGCLVTGATGLGVLAVGPPRWGSYLGGAAVMAVTVSFPLHLHAVRSPGGGAGAMVAGLRMTFVIGYIAGLTLAAIALATRTDIAPTTTVVRADADADADDSDTDSDSDAPGAGGTGAGDTAVRVERPPARPESAALVAAVGAVLLLKASDSIRLVYLPLFATLFLLAFVPALSLWILSVM